MNRNTFLLPLVTATALFSGCAATSSNPVPRVANVDLARYMGPWYVIASIPLSLEKGAHCPVETYSRNPDGSIATVFQFRKKSFDGTLETKPTLAEVQADASNAEWKVRTIWPMKNQYVISHLEPDYSAALIARDRRDHVWILSRTPKISDAKRAEYQQKIASYGYDVSKLHYFPQNGNQPWQ